MRNYSTYLMRRCWRRGVFQCGDKRVLGVDLAAAFGNSEVVVKTLGDAKGWRKLGTS